FPLPDYTEIPVEVPMAPEQVMLYETLKEQLKEELQERLVQGDKSLLSAYLYALLFWPDSPRRAKVVNDPRTGETVAAIPGLPEEFVGPKEKAIVELCQQEKAEGRKVLLLCLQTDTLDIQPEWKRMLEEAGLKTAVLRAAPNKRESWVEKQVQAGIDVIISHPKKVETGIDLLDFPTIVWMSPHYSVYTVLQASRRSWRIGQTQPVKVYYFAYADTIQEQALYLVAAKVAAALRVNGDTIADDSLAELDGITGNDIVATLARIVTGDTELNTQSLQNAFAEANASLRQANAIIGDYEIVDDEPEVVTSNGVQTIPQQVPLFSEQSRSNGHRTNGKSATMPVVTNGRHTHHSQFDGNDHTYKNGNQPEPGTNEKQLAPLSSLGAGSAKCLPPRRRGASGPPVPRPRLLMNLP
ncbi:MAG: hypothetical protein KC421_10845, partial [Anaerolineales bacterium]|nr:hypothetical protein [Anaerolineales bacterium]